MTPSAMIVKLHVMSQFRNMSNYVWKVDIFCMNNHRNIMRKPSAEQTIETLKSARTKEPKIDHEPIHFHKIKK